MKRLYRGYEIRNREQERHREQSNPDYARQKRKTQVRDVDMARLNKFKSEHGLD